MKLVSVLIALAWATATVGVPCAIAGRNLNLGFVIALALGIAAGLTEWRALITRRNSTLFRALGLGLLAFLLPASAHGFDIASILFAGRGCCALAWFALLVGLGSERISEPLGAAATCWLIANVALVLARAWLPEYLDPFEIAAHEYVGTWPRFRSVAYTPSPAGIWALVGIGLNEPALRPAQRWLGRVLGLLEAAATLSVGLLALPALFASLLKPARLRWLALLCAATLAAGALYFQPLELNVGSRTIVLSHLHPNYATDGMGPRYMPEKTFRIPGFALRGHMTAYGELAVRGATCFAEHPLIGVGPGRFREQCEVMAMNTFGEWTAERGSHNQLGAVFSELGLLGVALLTCAWLALKRQYTLQEMTPWRVAVWSALLVCGLGSEDLLTLPVLALLASQLVRREPLLEELVIAPARSDSV